MSYPTNLEMSYFGVLFGILGVMFSVPIGLALGILANKEKTGKVS